MSIQSVANIAGEHPEMGETVTKTAEEHPEMGETRVRCITNYA